MENAYDKVQYSLTDSRYRDLNKSSAVAEIGDRLATIGVGQKVGAAVPLPWGSWVPI